MIGKTLSHYKVLEKIGLGGMGEVYRAEDTNLSREVAIKVLPEELQQDSTSRKRFLREAKSAAGRVDRECCRLRWRPPALKRQR